MSDVDKICRHIYLSGRVQGVGFRAFVRKNARLLDLEGWVKNLPDGRVEAIVAGPEKKVEKLIDLMRDGPDLARVSDIEITTMEVCNPGKPFAIKY